MPKSIQAPLEPPSDPAIQRLRVAISKVVTSWPGAAGYLVYELMLAAATLTRLEGLDSKHRRKALTDVLERVLAIQDRREQEKARAEPKH
jgi:hypothetical protein